jgi:hypothetical protein
METTTTSYGLGPSPTEKGARWETEIQQAYPHPLERASENEDSPDLFDCESNWGLEAKHRSGTYQTTTSHVYQGMMPKYYQGRWVPNGYTRAGKPKYWFIPFKDANGDFIIEPEYAHSKLFVVMDNLAAPNPNARELLDRVHIQLVTLYEIIRLRQQHDKVRTPISTLDKREIDELYPFSLSNMASGNDVSNSSVISSVCSWGPDLSLAGPPALSRSARIWLKLCNDNLTGRWTK